MLLLVVLLMPILGDYYCNLAYNFSTIVQMIFEVISVLSEETETAGLYSMRHIYSI